MRRRERRRSDGELTGSMAFPSGPLRETPSQASTTHTRSKSFGVFTSAPGPQQPDSARQERSTAFTVRSVRSSHMHADHALNFFFARLPRCDHGGGAPGLLHGRESCSGVTGLWVALILSPVALITTVYAQVLMR